MEVSSFDVSEPGNFRLQMQRGNRDNLGKISLYFHSNIHYDPALELSH